jgi:hypothetical protein
MALSNILQKKDLGTRLPYAGTAEYI